MRGASRGGHRIGLAMGLLASFQVLLVNSFVLTKGRAVLSEGFHYYQDDSSLLIVQVTMWIIPL